MIPDLPNLSNPAMPAELRRPYNRKKQPLTDYARGGIALLDASKGLDVRDWFVEINEKTCFLSPDGGDAIAIETFDIEPSWVSLAFDQNMHYNLVYTIKANSYLHWYDTERQSYVTDMIGTVNTPFIRMDDVRHFTEGTNDIILSYIVGSALCVRVQRDRFKTEYVLAHGAGSKILQCGMNRKLRFQWDCG